MTANIRKHDYEPGLSNTTPALLAMITILLIIQLKIADNFWKGFTLILAAALSFGAVINTLYKKRMRRGLYLLDLYELKTITNPEKEELKRFCQQITTDPYAPKKVKKTAMKIYEEKSCK